MTLTDPEPGFQGHFSVVDSTEIALNIPHGAHIYSNVTTWRSGICYRKSACLSSVCP